MSIQDQSTYNFDKKTVLKKLSSNDENFNVFCQYFLESMKKEFLPNHEQLKTFLEHRYQFFSKQKFDALSIHLDPLLEKTGIYSVDILAPDMPLLLMTIEEVFKARKIPVLRIHHPIIAVQTNDEDHLIKIFEETSQASESFKHFSYCYIEFEASSQQNDLDGLLRHLRENIQTVSLINKDMPKMKEAVEEVQEKAKQFPTPLVDFHQEWVQLFDWLLHDENFSFFGFASFELCSKKENEPKIIKENHYGILNDNSPYQASLIKALTSHVTQMQGYRSPYIFDTLNQESPVKRFEKLMRLSLKIPTGDKLIEYNFLGLLKRSSMFNKNTSTPIIRLKLKKIFQEKGIIQDSYNYNQVIRFMTAVPKFELFRTATQHLSKMTSDLLEISKPTLLYCFGRQRIVPEHFFIMVVMPPQRFSSANKKKISDFLKNYVPHKHIEIIEVFGDQYCRLHFHFQQEKNQDWNCDFKTLELELRGLINTWEDSFTACLQKHYDQEKFEQVSKRYLNAFPKHHRVRRSPEETVQDVENFERLLSDNEIQFNLVPFCYEDSVFKEKVSILYFYNKTKIDLIDIMPILENLEIHVYDQLTTRVGPKEKPIGYIHAFRIASKQKEKLDEAVFKPLLLEFFAAYYRNETSNDPLNGLVMKAKMTWRQVNILKAFREWYLQLGSPYVKEKINESLLNFELSSLAMINYFEKKFACNDATSAPKRLEEILPKFDKLFFDSLQKVEDIASDVIFKNIFILMKACVRCNAFKHKAINESYLSFKLDPSLTKEMPLPKPYREIFVYDVNMMGVHLRFGPASRGGIRWSDRQADFRKEVLELVKTQQSKNVVIVPVGSKGGFVVKKSPNDRQAAYQEGIKQYKRFISALLDITDTIDDQGQVIHPENVLIYDEKDPYLVVAADKGTAAFSDFANEISESRNFWLGDAFASGGAKGYNHKEVGITAKGAWECVKCHFKEMGHDTQTQPFTTIGIGDMSGDVFGNGMLLSRQIKLIAAFNHQHIFIDPNPDPESSFRERERLFNLEKSSWEDYDPSVMSKGAGVFSRKSKEISLNKEIRSLLGIKETILNGEQLISCILKAETDLLWFGGIGTYIKANDELNSRVGDPANNSVRINVEECKARVIGEGANLGITPMARILLSRNGHRLNADFIDNSAGVNMSDYEVNIKILFKKLLDNKQLQSLDARNRILREIEDEVTELVLKNNLDKHQMLSMDAIRSQKNLQPFIDILQKKIKEGDIDPKSEVIPPHRFFEDLKQKKAEMPRPMLALLQAYIKMEVFDALLESPLLDNEALINEYRQYFPATLQARFEKHLTGHHLQKQILATVLCNGLINQSGMLCLHQAKEKSQYQLDELCIAFLLFNKSLDAKSERQKIKSAYEDINEQYQHLITFEEKLADAFISYTQAYLLNFENYELLKKNIDEIFVQSKVYKKSKYEYLFKFNDALKMMQLVNIKSDEAIKVIELLDDSLSYFWIKEALNQVVVTNSWEGEQKKSLALSLNQVIKNLTQYLLKNKKEELSTTDKLTLDLKFYFSEEKKKRFDSLIKEAKLHEKPSLTMLTVLIQLLEIV